MTSDTPTPSGDERLPGAPVGGPPAEAGSSDLVADALKELGVEELVKEVVAGETTPAAPAIDPELVEVLEEEEAEGPSGPLFGVPPEEAVEGFMAPPAEGEESGDGAATEDEDEEAEDEDEDEGDSTGTDPELLEAKAHMDAEDAADRAAEATAPAEAEAPGPADSFAFERLPAEDVEAAGLTPAPTPSEVAATPIVLEDDSDDADEDSDEGSGLGAIHPEAAEDLSYKTSLDIEDDGELPQTAHNENVVKDVIRKLVTKLDPEITDLAEECDLEAVSAAHLTDVLVDTDVVGVLDFGKREIKNVDYLDVLSKVYEKLGWDTYGAPAAHLAPDAPATDKLAFLWALLSNMKEHKGKWGGSTAIIIGLVAAVLSSGNTTDSPKKGSDATPPAASAPANPGPSTAPAPSPRTAPATPETPTQAFLAEVNRRLNPDNHTEAHCNERIAYFENNPNAVEGEMAAPEALLRWRQNRTFVRRVGQVRAIVAHIEAGQLDRLEEYADVALNPHNQDRAYFEGLRGNRNYGAIVDRSLAELELKPRLLQMIRQARAARSEDR